MTINKRYLAAAALGIFFGTGFLCGFLSGYRYAVFNAESKLSVIVSEDREAGDSLFSEFLRDGTPEQAEGEADVGDIGLMLEEYWMDSDDNGLFIAGAIRNSDNSAFDSVRVAFDLLDGHEEAYSAVTVRNNERMEPGDTWDFTVYIPYSEMDKFNSFRFQSVMGVKR